MKWDTIRAEYTRLFLAAKDNNGATQSTIARAGGLIGRDGAPQQSAISKLRRNRKQGPSVETFVRAVEGLGIAVSEFFALVERQEYGASVDRLDAPGHEPTVQGGISIAKGAGKAFALETLVGALVDALEPPARRRLVRRLTERPIKRRR